jgi:hypothetical protein
MVASVTRIQSPLNFLLNQTVICFCRPQIFEVRHIFKRSARYFHVPILPCILVACFAVLQFGSLANWQVHDRSGTRQKSLTIITRSEANVGLASLLL